MHQITKGAQTDVAICVVVLAIYLGWMAYRFERVAILLGGMIFCPFYQSMIFVIS